MYKNLERSTMSHETEDDRCCQKKSRVSDREMEYDRIYCEMKYISWKLYDLTCDFKDLQVDTKQLYDKGCYNRYEIHRRKCCDEDASKRCRKCEEYSATKDLGCSFKRDFEEGKCREERTRCRLLASPPPSSCRKYKVSRDYEGCSTEELEQKLREKLELLQLKSKCMKRMSCGNESYEREDKNTIKCCRGKERSRHAHTPHRCYLQGDRTYVIDHTDSKVIVIPKNIEY